MALSAGLEECKARESEAGKEGANEDDVGGSDSLIKRKVMVGQAISVVGGYPEKEKAPSLVAVKRLPEPILPSAQTKSDLQPAIDAP